MLTWIKNPGGKACLCMVYRQPDGRLVVNTRHGHNVRECQAKQLQQEALLPIEAL